MESLMELYRIGKGPSSSHTMGPSRAASLFKEKYPNALSYEVTLYGSLAATGKGHLTEKAILDILPKDKTKIIWKKNKFLPEHPNGMKFVCKLSAKEKKSWVVFSIGGGAIRDAEDIAKIKYIYPYRNLKAIMNWCEKEGKDIAEYAYSYDRKELMDFLAEVWVAMQNAIKRGLENDGILPGELKLRRRASSFYIKSKNSVGFMQKTSLVFAYALAVAEENAGGGEIVTAPTCGSAGILPAVLKVMQETYHLSDRKIINALATAGIIGNLIKYNASIAGAEVGCQGEVGAACSMAAAAATQLLGGGFRQIEYAAEMAMEHHLGLTCDPVAGLVQIPCIERNAMAAERALDCAVYALHTDGTHKISFDEVVSVMKQTGIDMCKDYKETSKAGLAAVYNKKRFKFRKK
jgi:L-serine dehydratase